MKPTIGRIVHFVQKRSQDCGEGLIHLPAIIVAVWSDTCVNLQVFTDGYNSEPTPGSNPQSAKWVTSVLLDESGTQERTWHWPERD